MNHKYILATGKKIFLVFCLLVGLALNIAVPSIGESLADLLVKLAF